jgi:hypothetical protein
MEASGKELPTGVFTDISGDDELIGLAGIFTATTNRAVRFVSNRAGVSREHGSSRTSSSNIRIWVAARILIFPFD